MTAYCPVISPQEREDFALNNADDGDMGENDGGLSFIMGSVSLACNSPRSGLCEGLSSSLGNNPGGSLGENLNSSPDGGQGGEVGGQASPDSPPRINPRPAAAVERGMSKLRVSSPTPSSPRQHSPSLPSRPSYLSPHTPASK